MNKLYGIREPYAQRYVMGSFKTLIIGEYEQVERLKRTYPDFFRRYELAEVRGVDFVWDLRLPHKVDTDCPVCHVPVTTNFCTNCGTKMGARVVIENAPAPNVDATIYLVQDTIWKDDYGVAIAENVQAVQDILKSDKRRFDYWEAREWKDALILDLGKPHGLECICLRCRTPIAGRYCPDCGYETVEWPINT